MSKSNQSYDFNEKIEDLKNSINYLSSSHFTYERDFKKFKLFSLIETMNETKPIQDFDHDRYNKVWQNVISKGFQIKLSNREVRCICCIPEIVCNKDNAFINYIQGNNLILSSKSILGLLFSLHYSWDKYNINLARYIKDVINKTNTRNRVIVCWKDGNSIELLVDKDGPKLFAESTFNDRLMPSKVFDKFGIQTNTLFFAEYIYNTVKQIVNKNDDFEKDAYQYLVQILNDTKTINETEIFIFAYSELIIRADSENIEWLKHQIRDTLLNHKYFGDPRVKEWIGCDAVENGNKAKQIFIQWLSAADIRFFFTEIIRNDPHERKDFWLRYIGSIKRSRVAIGSADRYRLRNLLKEEEEKGRDFAEYNLEDTSAFILDFGNTVSVEFSTTGNACYNYQKNDFEKANKDFYRKNYSYKDLKVSHYMEPPNHGYRQVHKPPPRVWQGELGAWLAKKGIRPGKKD